MFKRTISDNLAKSIAGEPQVTILYGPRQAGKTTLINQIAEEFKLPIQQFVGDDLYAQKIFSRPELEALKREIDPGKLLIIDEAQRIDNIGLTLKLLIDQLKIPILVSGSASFDLANKVSEPLTGRAKTFYLYPLSWSEASVKYRSVSPDLAVSEMLRFGMYPKVMSLPQEIDKQDYLNGYINNYLYKDILSFGEIRKPAKIMDLLQLLALQIGQEVSIAELSQNLSLSQKSVANYLDVLEKMFVVFNLRGFSRNLRKEISKTSKYFFYDVGLRNAVIRNYNPLNLRSDTGALFENWFIAEKIKSAEYRRQPANFYFWRTYDQKEIDLIEDFGGKLSAYECKFSAGKTPAAPKDFMAAYDNAEFFSVNAENYSQYL